MEVKKHPTIKPRLAIKCKDCQKDLELDGYKTPWIAVYECPNCGWQVVLGYSKEYLDKWFKHLLIKDGVI